MPEYIEREAFIKRLENEADKSSDIINLLILNGIANIVRDENIAPAADVVEVVHGEWVETYQPLGFDEVKCAECSSCGEDWIMDDDVCIDDYKAHWKYCPCCGAKMDGKENGNNGN